jgi:NAD(P)-dependent dehydrogenase (short-subunit alcohol dehydrogenase family)
MAGMLENKVALVTGAGNGIGQAAALAFAREGARVAVADIEAESAAKTVALINEAGGQAISLTGDVTAAEQVQKMLTATVAAYGRLDCAFNNAGVAGHQVDSVGQKIDEWSEASFDRMIAINLKSVWLCMKYEIPLMKQAGGGAIVNTASILGLRALPNSSAYIAAKHGVVGLTKSAAVEYSAAGIRVNAVCPGFIATRMTDPARATREAAVVAHTPAARYGEPKEIAEMVVWLCSDRASYVSGAACEVDGGYTAT